MKIILIVVFTIIGTLIGAGFASGKEIYLFFNCYGKNGIIGIIFFSICMGIIIYEIFQILANEKVYNYPEFINKVSKIKFLKDIISVFLIFSFYIMISGMNAYFRQQFNIAEIFTSIIMSTLCYVVLRKDIKGIIVVNKILTPFLIFFIAYLGVRNIKNTPSFSVFDALNYQNINVKFFLSSLIYLGYNTLILIPVLVQLKKQIHTKKCYKQIGIFCGFILSILGISVFYLLENNGMYIKDIELPLLEAVKMFGVSCVYIYGIVIVISIFTSAISAGYSFLDSQIKCGNNYEQILKLICLIAPVLSNIKFSNLIKVCYPILGVIGIFQIYEILEYGWKLKKQIKQNINK